MSILNYQLVFLFILILTIFSTLRIFMWSQIAWINVFTKIELFTYSKTSFYTHKIKFTHKPVGCKISKPTSLTEFFQNVQGEEPRECAYERKLSWKIDEQTLFISTNESCHVQDIIRAGDYGYRLTKSRRISNGSVTLSIEVGAKVLKCGQSLNFELFIPTEKSGVKAKLDYWRKVPLQDRPISVLLLGLDSLSRAHTRRGLPETMKILAQYEFIDFHQYHSLAPASLPNFLGFLTGQTLQEVRKGCASDRRTPFDACPFIWKNFSEHNYVTAFIEDGDQSLNWGDYAGFTEEPTDIYFHHFFLALTSMRRQQLRHINSSSKKNWSTACTSNESVCTFLLDYVWKFTRKFQEFPFFMMTWINKPFHEDSFAIYNYDQQISTFLRNTFRERNILNRVLIVLLSDHGDRRQFFKSHTVESYVERLLPPLFVRLPDIAKKKYPKFQEALISNSKRLTTPFDLHHTLGHILALQFGLKFTEILPSRNSLFTAFPSQNRDCVSTNIPSTHCLCGVETGKNGTFPRTFRVSLLQFVLDKLNNKILLSKYNRSCSLRSSSPKLVHYIHLIVNEDNRREFVIQFDTMPLATFEARIFQKRPKIHHWDYPMHKSEGMELLGIYRVDSYLSQSFCVENETDFDKEMKEICQCKMQGIVHAQKKDKLTQLY